MEKCTRSAIKMQRIWRGREGRERFKLAKATRMAREKEEAEAATKLQSIYRGRRQMRKMRKVKLQEEEFERKKQQAAIFVQRTVRGKLARNLLKRKQRAVEEKHLAALKLQCMWRKKKGSLCAHLIRQAKRDRQLEMAAIRVQSCWRARQGLLARQLLSSAKREQEERETAAVIKLQTLFRSKKGIERVLAIKKRRMEGEIRQRKLEDWAAIKVQSTYRAILGRRRAALQREAKMRRWKEMYDEAQDRPFYYNQDTGEVRWRKPQALLELQPRPVCSNCEDKEAIIECGDCTEYFCESCWQAVHYGGFRAKHQYRSLYDAYGRRVDYGDGEWPSIWPTEIEQDDLVGWQRLKRQEMKAKGLKPVESNLATEAIEQQMSTSYSDSDSDSDSKAEERQFNWSKHWDDSHSCYYYFNSITEESTYDRPADYSSDHETSGELWQKYWDSDSKSYFYHNDHTGESTFTRPDEYVSENSDEDDGDQFHAREEDKPETEETKWVKKYDKHTLKVFFHNPSTGISIFERPLEYTTPREEKENRNVWEKYEDKSTKRPYYFHKKTGEVQYERPPGYESPRPDKWTKFYDEESERPYYFNETTGLSQYMRPADFKTPRNEDLEQYHAALEKVNKFEIERQEHIQKQEKLQEHQNNKIETKWIKGMDDLTLQETYTNIVTGEVIAERPPNFETPRDYVNGEQLEWIRMVDESSGEEYYYNLETHETRIGRPDGFQTPREDEWEKFFDEDTGHFYYYNHATSESQYARPVGFHSPRETQEYL